LAGKRKGVDSTFARSFFLNTLNKQFYFQKFRFPFERPVSKLGVQTVNEKDR
jgi:hypothetical protein